MVISSEPLPRHDPEAVGVDAWAGLLRVHASLTASISAEVERKAGLSLAFYDVLLELNNAPNRRLRMSELAERVVLSRTRVSRVVDEMVASDLVRKVPDPDDGRATLADIAPGGRVALRRAAPIYLAAIRATFTDRLSTEQLVALRDSFAAVLESNEGRD